MTMDQRILQLFLKFLSEILMVSCLIYGGGARGVMVIVTGYGHSDTNSIPGQD